LTRYINKEIRVILKSKIKSGIGPIHNLREAQRKMFKYFCSADLQLSLVLTGNELTQAWLTNFALKDKYADYTQ